MTIQPYEPPAEVIEELRGLRPGMTFNFWTVVGYSHRGKGFEFKFRCQCGKERVCNPFDITSGRSKSCRKCSAKVVGETTHKIHGKSKSKAYRTWQSMKTRCYNQNNAKSYKYHGARGIKVCDEWLNDFEAFYAHIGDPPTPLHTIDRIDVDGHYEPGNVRWATQWEQQQNTRRKRKTPQQILDR